jgi:hypothetical protein
MKAYYFLVFWAATFAKCSQHKHAETTDAQKQPFSVTDMPH